MTTRNKHVGPTIGNPEPAAETVGKKTGRTSGAEKSASSDQLRSMLRDLEEKQAALEAQNKKLRKAQAALRESELKLNCIIQGSPIPTFVICKDHKVIHWNKALEAISGIRADDVMGTSLHWRAFYDHERPCLADLLIYQDMELVPHWYFGKYIRSELIPEAYEAIDFFPDLGDSGKWLHFTAALIRDTAGKIVGAIETLKDVTDHKKAEIALRESEQRHREIFNATAEAIFIQDAVTGCILDVNAAAIDIFGYRDKNEIRALSVGQLSADSPPYNEAEAWKRIRAAVAGDPQRFRWKAKRKNGDTFPVEITLRRSHIGGSERVIAVVRDITNRKGVSREE